MSSRTLRGSCVAGVGCIGTWLPSASASLWVCLQNAAAVAACMGLICACALPPSAARTLKSCTVDDARATSSVSSPHLQLHACDGTAIQHRASPRSHYGCQHASFGKHRCAHVGAAKESGQRTRRP